MTFVNLSEAMRSAADQSENFTKPMPEPWKPTCPGCGATEYKGSLEVCSFCDGMVCSNCDKGESEPCRRCQSDPTDDLS